MRDEGDCSGVVVVDGVFVGTIIAFRLAVGVLWRDGRMPDLRSLSGPKPRLSVAPT